MKHTITLLLLIGTFSASGQWLTDSLIAHFPMDGTPDDVIGGLVPVVTSGAPAFCADRHGMANGAACFDGSSFWSYGDVLDMDTSRYSVSLWCRIDSITPNANHHDYPLSKGTTVSGSPPLSGYSMGFRDELPDTLSAAALFGNNTQSLLIMAHPVTFGSWYHYTISRCAGDAISLSINGILVTADQLAPNKNLSTNIHFSIGAGERAPAAPPGGFFSGAVDDVRLYKGRCLSQDEIDVLADITVGLNDRRAPLAVLRLYPNPARTSLRVDLPAQSRVTGPITTLNALGQAILLSEAIVGVHGNSARALTLDVSDLPKGAYFVVVPTEEGSLHGRFIKE